MSPGLSDLTSDDVDCALAVARCLHSSERVATGILLRAFAQLEAARERQEKRAHCSARSYKLRLSTPHLLHKLVLIESERAERATERDGTMTDRDLILRYVKQLILLSVEHNAFYATLAVARVLYAYTTAEAMDLYGAVQDEEPAVKEPYYYRSRRQRILAILLDRFGPRLQFVRASRGERQLLTVAPCEEMQLEIEYALERLVPWRDGCQASEDPMSRLHMLFHPPCFAALAAQLGLDPPAARLRVPQFAAAPARVTVEERVLAGARR